MFTAVKVAAPIVLDETVKVTFPLASELPDAAEIESVPPRLEVKLTDFPEIIPLFAESLKLTVIVDTLDPLATTEDGEAGAENKDLRLRDR